MCCRAEIRRLTKLLNETPSRRSSQMAELSELDENIRDIVDEVPPSSTNAQPNLRFVSLLNVRFLLTHLFMSRRPLRPQVKREAAAENQAPPVYGKNLPKKVKQSMLFNDQMDPFLLVSRSLSNVSGTKYCSSTSINVKS